MYSDLFLLTSFLLGIVGLSLLLNYSKSKMIWILECQLFILEKIDSYAKKLAKRQAFNDKVVIEDPEGILDAKMDEVDGSAEKHAKDLELIEKEIEKVIFMFVLDGIKIKPFLPVFLNPFYKNVYDVVSNKELLKKVMEC